MNIPSQIKTLAQSDQVRSAALKGAKVFKPVTTVAHRHGAEILTGTGIIGGIGTVVLASRATLKLEEIVDQTKAAIEYAEATKAANNARVEGLLKITKLYAPAATLGTASVAAVLGAHGIMRKRNIALAAAYKAIETTFNEYRKRVVAEYGEEKDRDFRYGFKDIERKTEDGKKETITTVTKSLGSPYARIFDESNPEWSKTSEYNKVFLLAKQAYLNNMLQARGHVFLNEVYRELGFEHSKQGAVTGWIMEKNNPSGDNYIDFGIFDLGTQEKRNFVNGHERSILLDFNVDGLIIDRI